MKKFNFSSFSFFKSFSRLNSINFYSGLEIALLGYSNVGKSTLINVLSNKKKLSRVSKLPGSTQLINCFKNDRNFKILDLPGYGYSSFIKSKKINWKKDIKHFFSFRKTLIGVIILIDIRFIIKKNDMDMIYFFYKKNIKMVILLNKCDKINFSLRIKKYNLLINKLNFLNFLPKIIIFSSLKKIGLFELKKILINWYISNI
ncbi:MAG: ribosome biogenesis GTP-binding protein YsxC [Buchnera aphidicola (Periphyllus lyropictus)]|uniref:ribosome biogenesis GTP-binding protein YihA/YsxC n=1 Tax=Buchnera aphidicola TaxID=9 RepID=UPI001EC5DB5D|nr:ribosome biogenesis GTP-binding protein YihA/YsxC [Buchnera aphidicola]NIH16548.1 ribosome biogenesis GTP-binding protein YsxC [Buchnera aphidicola (Periphyllus lyropictus)]USS94441.1 ribosome biogenesis GTP-binding protein YihA/YsxC [Buchnera aphidicola (Periphyllus lyropictus)]